MLKFQSSGHPHEANQIATGTDINGGNLSPLVATWSAWCSNYRMRAEAGSQSQRTKSAIRVVWTQCSVEEAWEEGESPINPGTGQRCRSSGLPSAPPPTPRAATRSTLYRCLTSEYRYRSCSSHQNGSTSSNIYKHRLVKVY